MTPHEALEARVTRLEEHHAEKMVQLGVIHERQAELAKKLGTMCEMMESVRDRVMLWRDCPEPGLCVHLRDDIRDLNNKVGGLVLDRDAIVKSWKGIGLVAGAAITILTIGYSIWIWLEKIVHQNKVP
jgi:hypothetical protein